MLILITSIFMHVLLLVRASLLLSSLLPQVYLLGLLYLCKVALANAGSHGSGWVAAQWCLRSDCANASKPSCCADSFASNAALASSSSIDSPFQCVVSSRLLAQKQIDAFSSDSQSTQRYYGLCAA
eukprot:COSAG01_NODE_411_length_17360_cov_11.401852_12_plen_126_part_00